MYSTRVIKGAEFKYRLLKEFKEYPASKGLNKITCVCFNKKEADQVVQKHHDKVRIVVLYLDVFDKSKYEEVPAIEAFYIMCYGVKELNHYINLPVDQSETRSYITFGCNYSRKYFYHCHLRSWSHVRESPYVTYFIDEHHLVSSKYFKMYNACSLKSAANILETREVFRKDKLNLLFPNEPFIPKYYTLDGLLAQKSHEHIYIFKPKDGSTGSGIFIIDPSEPNWQDTLKAKWVKDNEPYAITQYIDNPLLFDKKKFHIRSYLMLTSWGAHFSFKPSRILTAMLPYKQLDYLNPDIHDTHLRGTIGYPMFPEDMIVDSKGTSRLTKTDGVTPILLNDQALSKIWDNILSIHKRVSESSNITHYQEVKECYNCMGLDFLFDEDLNIYLLEINTRPLSRSIYDHMGPSDKLDKAYADWVLESIKDKLVDH